MKWTKKGHEYDDISMNFNSGTKIWIYGAGENGNTLYHLLRFTDCIEGFIDNAPQKIQAGCWNGKKLISSEAFLKSPHNNCIVIIATALENTPLIIKQMIRNGWKEGIDLFTYHIFCRYYLPIWSLRSWDKVYIPTISFLVTTMCNLDCIGCLNFTHFNKNKYHYDIERMKKDMDILFEKIDYVGYLHLSGGEPFLHPHFEELINYIYSRYNGCIGTLATSTNGTILPSESLCRALKNANMEVIIDDYRENVKLCAEKFEQVKSLLETYGISPIVRYEERWFDIQKSGDTDDEDLCVRCDACDVPFVSVKEHKLFGCNYCDYAHEASLSSCTENDYLDLEQIAPDKKAYITEFIMGYSQNGYYSFCKNCSGFLISNQKHIKVAEQYRGG